MMPIEVVQIRQDVCRCEGVNHADPCAVCPQGHFGRYEETRCDDPSTMGDRIARVAQPIARMLDTMLGTKVAECGGCKEMQADLNAGMSIPAAMKRRLQKRN